MPGNSAAAKKQPTEFGALADELGSLEKEMAQHAPKLARIEALRKALRVGCLAKAKDQWTVEGKRFVAILGPCAIQRVIDIPALVKAIGAGIFAKFATCTLKDLEANVAAPVVVAVVSADNTGSRPLKTFEKPA